MSSIPASELASCPAAADAELVARIRQGDQRAFEALHAQYHDALWRFAYTQVRCTDLAEEIVQDVFFALWRKRAEWEITATVAGWLFGAARHHVLRRRRQAHSVVRLADRIVAYADRSGADTADDAIPVGMGSASGDAHRAVEERETDEMVIRALERLPERRRIAMTLRWKHQLAGPEIARVMGTTPEAVRVLLTRARQELAALIGSGDA